MLVDVPLVGGSDLGRSTHMASRRVLNLYPEAAGKGAALIGVPGTVAYRTDGTGPIRGQLSTVGGHCVVSGNALYVDGVLKGTIGSATGRVGMADNGIDLVIGDGSFYYYRYSDGAFSTISGAPAGWSCAYSAQAIFMVEQGSGKLWYSALGDASTVDGLDFVTAESAPDDLVAVVSDRTQLWLFGDTSVEVWAASGGENYIERYPGGVLQGGCVAPHSIQRIDNSLFWVGRDEHGQGIVRRDEGYRPSRVSTHAVEYWLAQGDLSNAYAWVYSQEGHTFYVLSVPGLDSSWVYDAATQTWHERAWWSGSAFETHRGGCHALVDGLNIIGDRDTGALYRLSLSANTDDGDALIATVRTPHIHDKQERFVTGSLFLDMETGVNDAPQVMLRVSDDGGFTWGVERWVSAGSIGDYRRRVKWHRLGQSRNRVYEFTVSDDARRILLGAAADVT